MREKGGKNRGREELRLLPGGRVAPVGEEKERRGTGEKPERTSRSVGGEGEWGGTNQEGTPISGNGKKMRNLLQASTGPEKSGASERKEQKH